MNITIDIMQLITLITCIIALATFYFSRKKIAQQEGARMKQQDELQKKVDELEKSLEMIKNDAHKNEIAYARIDERLGNLEEMIREIKQKMDEKK